MAVSRNENNGSYKRRSGGVFRGSSRFLNNVVKVIIIIFIALCLFGVINQVAFGQSLWKWFVDTGTAVGHTLNYLFVGEDQNLPVDITDEGVYVDGFAPEGADNLSVEDFE